MNDATPTASTRVKKARDRMSEYTETVKCQHEGRGLPDSDYRRSHIRGFDGGLEVPGSALPQIVSLPKLVDPEQVFVAFLSGWRVPFLLPLVVKIGYVSDKKNDFVTVCPARNSRGKLLMTRIVPRPRVVSGGVKQPSAAQIGKMHARSHLQCFSAGTVTNEVPTEPRGLAE